VPPLLHPLLDRLAFWDIGEREEDWEGEFGPGDEAEMGDGAGGDVTGEEDDDDYHDMYAAPYQDVYSAPVVVTEDMVQQVCICVYMLVCVYIYTYIQTDTCVYTPT
jgi:hypothetical protein